MKSIQFLLLTTLLLAAPFCSAQQDSTKLKAFAPNSNLPAHFILTVDDKSLDIGTGQLGKVKLDDILAEWVSSVEVVKGEKAVEKYGESRKGGVVIINFKEFSLLSKKLQAAFINDKKE